MCNKLETSPLLFGLVVAPFFYFTFVLEKETSFVPFFMTRNFGLFSFFFTSPDDEIHLDGPVEFDHVDRHHFYPLGYWTQYLRNRWERACTVCRGGAGFFYYIKKIWIRISSLSLDDSIYNVVSSFSLWWRTLIFVLKDVLLREFSLFSWGLFSGSDLLLIHFMWILLKGANEPDQRIAVGGNLVVSICVPHVFFGIGRPIMVGGEQEGLTRRLFVLTLLISRRWHSFAIFLWSEEFCIFWKFSSQSPSRSYFRKRLFFFS